MCFRIRLRTIPDFSTIKETVTTAKNFYLLRNHLFKSLKNNSISQVARELLQKALIMDFFDAVQDGNTALVKEFLSSGMDPNIRTDYLSPLFVAAAAGKTEIAQLLINAGADVNFTSATTLTPLTKASERGHPLIVKMLLDADADMTHKATIEDDEEKVQTLDAREIAEQKDHHAVTQVFADHTSKVQTLIKKISYLEVIDDMELAVLQSKTLSENCYKELIDLCKERFVQAVREDDKPTIEKLKSIQDDRLAKIFASITVPEVKAHPPGATDVHATLYSKHKAPSIDTEPNPTSIASITPRKDKH